MYAAAALLFAGCPLYEDCDSSSDCASGYFCDRFSGRCEQLSVDIGCGRPEDCGSAETCTSDGVCEPGSCDYHGCVRGYTCAIVDATHTCVRNDGDAGPDASDDAATTEPPDASPDGSITPDPDIPDATPPADASAADASPDAADGG